jgi:hypothetical protein
MQAGARTCVNAERALGADPSSEIVRPQSAEFRGGQRLVQRGVLGEQALARVVEHQVDDAPGLGGDVVHAGGIGHE